jgi:hypothetical protein
VALNKIEKKKKTLVYNLVNSIFAMKSAQARRLFRLRSLNIEWRR